METPAAARAQESLWKLVYSSLCAFKNIDVLLRHPLLPLAFVSMGIKLHTAKSTSTQPASEGLNKHLLRFAQIQEKWNGPKCGLDSELTGSPLTSAYFDESESGLGTAHIALVEGIKTETNLAWFKNLAPIIIDFTATTAAASNSQPGTSDASASSGGPGAPIDQPAAQAPLDRFVEFLD